jgi:prefoldin alpha subunit
MSGQMNVADLHPQQLQRFAEQLNQEVASLTESFQQINGVRGKFSASGQHVSKLSKQTDGGDILVPLTESLYVPAKLATAESVLVDVGTGYYVEKSAAGAKDYCDRKVKLLEANMGKLSQQLGQRKEQLEVVNQVFHQKMAAMEQAREQQEKNAGVGS